jgi:membrane fusion protein, hemolysin D
MKSAEKIIPFPRKQRAREEIAFLPAALEVVETPPSPVGRAIAITIIAVACLALAWAAWGKVDIVASAPGQIIPSGKTKVVQPFETGVVRAIRVHDGQTVKAGDALIELDPTINAAEVNRLKADLIVAELDVARLQAALADTDDPLGAFKPPKDASVEQVAMQRQFLLNQVAEYRAKLAVLDRQRAQKEAEGATMTATIGKLQALIPVIEQRLEIKKTLYDGKVGSKAQYLELLQLLVEQQQELAVQTTHRREVDAAISTIMETRAQTVAEYRRSVLDDLAQARQKSAQIAQDLVKAEKRTELQVLTAPVDGVVQQLAVHTVGGVVTPAQTLLAVVPRDSELQIEAMVSNRDIGFVSAGHDVEIKVDTFPFTHYGLLHGKVLNVSLDSIHRDKPQDKPNERARGAEATTSEPAGQEMVYAARISLDRGQMQVEDKLVTLTPGMAVTAEIKTGSRTVLSYLLSPLVRYRQESLRER